MWVALQDSKDLLGEALLVLDLGPKGLDLAVLVDKHGPTLHAVERVAQGPVLVAEQGEGKVELLFPSLVIGSRVSRSAKDLGVLGEEIIVQRGKAVALLGSAARVRLGVPPDQQLLACEGIQSYGIASLVWQAEGCRSIANGCLHLHRYNASPKYAAKTDGETSCQRWGCAAAFLFLSLLEAWRAEAVRSQPLEGTWLEGR